MKKLCTVLSNLYILFPQIKASTFQALENYRRDRIVKKKRNSTAAVAFRFTYLQRYTLRYVVRSVNNFLSSFLRYIFYCRYISKWISAYRSNSTMRKALQFFLYSSLAKPFSRWIQFLDMRLEMRAKVEEFILRKKTRTRRHALKIWRGFSDKRYVDI